MFINLLKIDKKGNISMPSRYFLQMIYSKFSDSELKRPGLNLVLELLKIMFN